MKPFARQGHYTAVDNAILDELMATLSGNEFKLLMAIVRRTVGYQVDAQAIPLRDFQEITGISSRNTVVKNLAALEARGLVLRSDDGYRASYRLNRDFDMEHCAEIEQSADQHGTATVPKHGTATVPNMVQPLYHLPYIEKKKEREKEARPHKNCPMPQSAREEDLAAHGLTHCLLDAGFDWPGWRVLEVLIGRYGDRPLDAPLLAAARERWLLAGHNPRNLEGILDWYGELLADPAWEPYARNGRAVAPRADQAPAAQLSGSW